MLIPYMSLQCVPAAADYMTLGTCVHLLRVCRILVSPDVASAAEPTTAQVARATLFLPSSPPLLHLLRTRADGAVSAAAATWCRTFSLHIGRFRPEIPPFLAHPTCLEAGLAAASSQVRFPPPQWQCCVITSW